MTWLAFQTFLPPVDPITIGFDIVSGIVSVIGALFGGIFGGSANDNIIKAFNGLRQSMVDGFNKLLKFGWQIANAVGAIFNAIKWLWGNVLGPLVHAVRAILSTLNRVLNKILKPILDAMKAQRQAILDFYNKFVRPILVAIEKVRRIIHLLQLLHIHIFDKLDQELARIEGKLLAPIYRMLFRVNTLGNWINYILNLQGLLYRGLLLGSINQNRGGTFSLLAGAPPLGITPLPQTAPLTPAPVQPMTYDSLTASLNTALVKAGSALKPGSPEAQLYLCLLQPTAATEGQPVHDFLKCFFKGTPFEGMV
jgi:hypothetical protein